MKGKNTFNNILLFVGVVLLLVAIACAVKAAMDLPLVEISNSTGKCVSVHTPNGPGDCAHLPEKYEKVAVR